MILVVPVKLFELSPVFLKLVPDLPGHWTVARRIEDAQGVSFFCPKCYVANGVPNSTHRITCWSRSRGVPDDVSPGPGRWAIVGTGFGDLTLNADPPESRRSVQLDSGCRWHGFITAGEVTNA